QAVLGDLDEPGRGDRAACELDADWLERPGRQRRRREAGPERMPITAHDRKAGEAAAPHALEDLGPLGAVGAPVAAVERGVAGAGPARAEPGRQVRRVGAR